jgi:F-type H+-transporting ATPase subunit delta
MSVSTIAAEYAEALFNLASERGIRDELGEELRAVGSCIRDNDDIGVFFASPGTPRDEKLKVIDVAIAPHANAVTVGFLKLLVHKGREAFLARILDAFGDLVDKAEGRSEVDVTSAEPIAEETLAALTADLTRLTEKEVRVNAAVDASLIGGMTVRVGDRLLDASLSSRLRRLRTQALEA